jgi:dihydrofolate reductase
MTKIQMIWAQSRNGTIGNAGTLPWSLPNDLRFFKQQTIDTVVVMGKRTWKSIGRPLPKRHNIVLTRDPHYTINAENVTVLHDIKSVLAFVQSQHQTVSIIGGVSIFESFMPYATDLYVSHIDADIEGDTKMSPIDTQQFIEGDILVEQPVDDVHQYAFTTKHYQRR